MKEWFSIAAVVVLCLALVIGVACGGAEEEEDGVTELKFGIGVPLSGITGAMIGIPAKHAIELAAEKIGVFEVGGEQYRWELIIEDNNLGSAQGGAASATKFIYEDDVDFMHQTMTDAALAAEPLCEKAGVLLDTAGSSVYSFSPDTPSMFQVSFPLHFLYACFFDWVTKEHPEVRRVASVHSETGTGYDQHDAVSAACEYYGLEYMGVTYVAGTTEFYPTATKVLAFDPDLVLSSGGQPGLFEAMWEMGYEGLVNVWYWIEALATTMPWDKAAGRITIDGAHPFGIVWPEVNALRAEYEDRYDVDFGKGPFEAFNILYVYTDALKQAGTVDDLDKIIETLETGTFDSPIGPVSFGGEALNGVGHCLVPSIPIYVALGEDEV